MKAIVRLKNKFVLGVLLIIAMTVLAIGLLVSSPNGPTVAYAAEIDYTFETVPSESVTLTIDGNIAEIQPRQRFTVSYEINPWYTTTSRVYYDVFPETAATVTETQAVKVIGGKAIGKAEVTVLPEAVVNSTFKVMVSADDAESNQVELTVAKIPVMGIGLTAVGTDDRLHIGKTRQIAVAFEPSYATYQTVNYTLSGNGVQYIEQFDERKGLITAKNNVVSLDVNSTVTITAISVDNPNASSSVTFTLYLPTTIVELSASASGTTQDGKPLAIARSTSGDTVMLSTLVNNVPSVGLNYVIVSGQEYVVNGLVTSNGTFDLKPTVNWTSAMKVPHAEIKIRVAYSDGFDEIIVSIYVPIESISFVNSVPNTVENYRSYDLEAEAFPKFATYLADHGTIYYMLDDLSISIATIDGNGLVTLPKSLTSKGTIIKYSADLSLSYAWSGVDAAALTHSMTVVPVYASSFNKITVLRGGTPVDLVQDNILPSNILTIAVTYKIDSDLPENVTELNFKLTVLGDSNDKIMITAFGYTLNVAALSLMKKNEPSIPVLVTYDYVQSIQNREINIPIYVPALSAEIDDTVFHRDARLNIAALVTVNGHGFATNPEITWGTPTIVTTYSGQSENQINPSCEDGFLKVASVTHAGTVIKIPYKAFDSSTWQYKEFTVAPLSGSFILIYGTDSDSTDFDIDENALISKSYSINANAPQLEEGRTIDLRLEYEGEGAYNIFGVSYTITTITNNATLTIGAYQDKQDIFRLGAKSGQTGRNNYIDYLITITDGSSTYCIRTKGISKPADVTNEVLNERVEIFNRISGVVDVSNLNIQAGDTFTLTGWDDDATAKNASGEYLGTNILAWAIGLTNITSDKKMPADITQGFVLNLTAKQKYNGQDVSFSASITFDGSLTYMNDNTYVKRIFKKTGASLTIDDKETMSKSGYVHAGWTTSLDESKSSTYVAGGTFSGSDNVILYAWWVSTSFTINIIGEQTLDENQNQDQHTDYEYVTFDYTELVALGYIKIKIDMQLLLERTVHSGDFAKFWIDVDIHKGYLKDKFEPDSLRIWQCVDSVELDISAFSEKTSLRLGFYTYDDGIVGKFTWVFYKAELILTAIKAEE
jgi:hypothetical protein